MGGDFNGDGVQDWAVCCPDRPGLRRGSAGRVNVYSGASGAKLATFDGKQPGARFGISLAFLPDDCGDGDAMIWSLARI